MTTHIENTRTLTDLFLCSCCSIPYRIDFVRCSKVSADKRLEVEVVVVVAVAAIAAKSRWSLLALPKRVEHFRFVLTIFHMMIPREGIQFRKSIHVPHHSISSFKL